MRIAAKDTHDFVADAHFAHPKSHVDRHPYSRGPVLFVPEPHDIACGEDADLHQVRIYLWRPTSCLSISFEGLGWALDDPKHTKDRESPPRTHFRMDDIRWQF